jgi:putative tryptophan/tyrosine transport system substrate-binding protein
MNRRTFVHALTIAVAAPPLSAGAQMARETARIGFLSPGDRLSRGWQAEVLREALRGHGWVEGKNLMIEYRFGEERYERLRALADELVRLKVDLIFAASAPSAQAAKEATSTIPIVFSTLNDPVRAGLVSSFAFPGANVTGQGGLGPELDRKRLELLKEVVPSLSRATVLANPSNPMTPQRLSEIEAAAEMLKIQLQRVTASDAKGLDKAFQEMARARPSALIVFEDPVLIAHGRRIIEFSAQHRILTIYTSPGWAEQGGLIEYSASVREVLVRAAAYVNRILRGVKPADLPVEQPTKFELVINLKTAKALGLTIPPSLLARADQVIE